MTTDAFKTTLPSHIQLTKNLEKNKDEYFCIPCEKKFSSRTNIYYHYNCISEGNKKHKCENCKKSFSTRSHLNYHMETHKSIRHECLKCGKHFFNSKVLQKHMKLHERLTHAFHCSFCKKEFRYKETLAAHEAKHKNKLNFNCTDCDKKYTTKSALKQHKLKHTEKKHKCPKCGKYFLRNYTLKLHLKRHDVNEFFLCTTCFKKFSDASVLQRHVKIHSSDNYIKYKCKECHITTFRKDNMQRHLRIMHLCKSFDNYVEILRSEEQQVTVLNHDSAIPLPETLECNDNNLPKTVANSSVIKFIGNVEPIKVPNLVPVKNCVDFNETKEPATFAVLKTVSDIDLSKTVRKKYDPIEMYRKILNSDEQTESLNDEEPAEILPVAIKPVDNQQRNTSFANSNFSATHWRKNFQYTYTQHQD